MVYMEIMDANGVDDEPLLVGDGCNCVLCSSCIKWQLNLRYVALISHLHSAIHAPLRRHQ